MPGALPNVVLIGAMKCGTTALHRYLDRHPEVSMAPAKEVNFFQGPERPPDLPEDEWWRVGTWHRGMEWYAGLFDGAAPVRGESSPGYTSPDHPHVAGRMAAVVPDARLLCIVRDPVERAVSHYLHHRREGDEPRPVAEALLDPASQYLSRGRYHERLAPFQRHFAAAQLCVVVSERLRVERRSELARVYRHVGADPEWWDDDLARDWHVGESHGELPADVADRARDCVRDDVARLRELLGDPIPEWSV